MHETHATIEFDKTQASVEMHKTHATVDMIYTHTQRVPILLFSHILIFIRFTYACTTKHTWDLQERLKLPNLFILIDNMRAVVTF